MRLPYLITKREHDEIVAGKDAEIARLAASSLPYSARLVLEQMHADCGYPAAKIANWTGVPEKQVRAIIRGFEAYGWAFRHPFHSEDDDLIRGSGYSLTNAGWDARVAALWSRSVAEEMARG